MANRDMTQRHSYVGNGDPCHVCGRIQLSEAHDTWRDISMDIWRHDQRVRAEVLRRCAEEIENGRRNREIPLDDLIAWYRAQADNMDPPAERGAHEGGARKRVQLWAEQRGLRAPRMCWQCSGTGDMGLMRQNPCSVCGGSGKAPGGNDEAQGPTG